jgi:hypothetical protein
VNFFRALQIAILLFSFEISEHPKVGRADAWRGGGECTENLIAVFWAEKRFFSLRKDGNSSARNIVGCISAL